MHLHPLAPRERARAQQPRAKVRGHPPQRGAVQRRRAAARAREPRVAEPDRQRRVQPLHVALQPQLYRPTPLRSSPRPLPLFRGLERERVERRHFRQLAADRSRARAEARERARRLRRGQGGNARLEDARLLASDGLDRAPKNLRAPGVSD